MPLPVIWGVAAGIGALAGLNSKSKAKANLKEAEGLIDAANEKVSEAKDFIEMAQSNTVKAIEAFGKLKLQVLKTSMSDFVENFEKIKEVEFTDLNSMKDMTILLPGMPGFKQLKHSTRLETMSKIHDLVGFGSFGMLPILTTMPTMPTFSLMTAILQMKSQTALNNAKANYEKAKVYRAQAKSIGLALKAIFLRCGQMYNLLEQLDSYFSKSVSSLCKIIKSSGTNWTKYTPEQQKDIYLCVQIAQTVKIVMDTSLLTDDGELNEKSEAMLAQGNMFLQKIAKL